MNLQTVTAWFRIILASTVRAIQVRECAGEGLVALKNDARVATINLALCRTALVEAVEVTAIQRGAQRWRPS